MNAIKYFNLEVFAMYRITNHQYNLLLELSKYDDVFIVGGYVRDLLLGKNSNDIDVLAMKNAKEIAIELADKYGGSFIVLDEQHNVFRVVFTTLNVSIDIVGPKGPALFDDLRSRDFTVNGLAIGIKDLIDFYIEYNNTCVNLCEAEHDKTNYIKSRLNGITIDVVDGIKDLAEKRLAIVYEHTFLDDPLRILRGVRLAATHGFDISDDTIVLMNEAKHLIFKVSYERIREEIWSIFNLYNSFESMRFLDYEVPLLQELLGVASYDDKQSIARKIELLCQLEGILNEQMVNGRIRLKKYLLELLSCGKTRYQLLKFALLIHDVPSKQAENIARIWKLSKRETDILTCLVSDYKGTVAIECREDDKNKLYALYETLGVEVLGVIILQLIINEKSNDEVAWNNCLEFIGRYLAFYDSIEALPPLLTGQQLIDNLRIPPGPQVGFLLKLVRKAQITGQVNNVEEAFIYLRTYKSK